MTKRLFIDLIAAARPNFMKIAPLYHALAKEPWSSPRLVHTGQHYDANMSDAFLADLRLPTPHVHLGAGSGSHSEQTARVMIEYEKVCKAERPDWIIVAGDVNSTLACALVGAKLLIPVAHLEAGLRSGDRTMPEEINRIVTDALAELLWTPSSDADANLLREGVPATKIERVGNIMLDSFEMMSSKIQAARCAERLRLEKESYGVLTLHRPSNVDDPSKLTAIIEQLVSSTRHIPLVFPVHPRTRQRLLDFGLVNMAESCDRLRLTDPLSYVDFMSLVVDSRLVITDSGGIQEETTYLGIPCLTLRDTTERPITVIAGTNRMTTAAELHGAIAAVLREPARRTCGIPLWDGRTANRAVASLKHRALQHSR